MSVLKKPSAFGSYNGNSLTGGQAKQYQKTVSMNGIFYDSPSGSIAIKTTEDVSDAPPTAKNDEMETFASADDAGMLKERLMQICEDLGFSKTYLARVMSVSRRALYDWLEGKSRIAYKHLSKVNWLEDVVRVLPQDFKGKIEFWKERKIYEDRVTLEDLLIEEELSPSEIVKLLAAFNNKIAQRPRIGDWGNKEKARLSEISAAYDNNED